MFRTLIGVLILASAFFSSSIGLARGKLAIESSALRARLEQLITSSGGNRTAGLGGNKKAYDWLLSEAKKIRGWEVVEYSFVPDVEFALKAYRAHLEPFGNIDKKSSEYARAKNFADQLMGFAESLRGKKLSNLILRKKGSDVTKAKEPLVVTASFDTMTGRREPLELFPKASAPGADDNGAAVVSLLTIAATLENLKPARTVEFVFTNAEQAHYLGAHAYATALAAKEISARNINLKMIGWNALKNRVNVYVRPEGQPGYERDWEVGQAMVKALRMAGADAVVMRRNVEYGDNWAFWKAFHGAVMVSQDWEYGFNESHYRSRLDSPDTLDWSYVTKIARGTAAAIEKLAH